VNTALSWPESLFLVAGLLAPLFFPLLYFVLYRPKRGTGPASPISSFAASDGGKSFFHSWHTGLKVGCLTATCFLFVTLRDISGCLLALAIAALAMAMSGLPWRRSLARLAAMSGFLTLLLVMLPFSGAIQAGERTLSLAFLPDTFPLRLSGLYMAALIVLKAIAVALLMEPMLATASLADTLRGFRRIGLPASLTQMILLCHRYIFVFQQEAARMWQGMRVRGFVARMDRASLTAIGNFLGMLFVSSFERTQRVYEAMLCRGFTGEMPQIAAPQVMPKDLGKAVFWLALAVSPWLIEWFFPNFLNLLGG
jgi:cobalt/nickel transport system permease protein